MKVSNNIRDINYHFPDGILSESKFSRSLRDLNLSYKFIVIQKYEHRPDLISEKIYKTQEYDWLILFITGLTKEELILGTELNLPTLSELSKLLMND